MNSVAISSGHAPASTYIVVRLAHCGRGAGKQVLSLEFAATPPAGSRRKFWIFWVVYDSICNETDHGLPHQTSERMASTVRCDIKIKHTRPIQARMYEPTNRKPSLENRDLKPGSPLSFTPVCSALRTSAINDRWFAVKRCAGSGNVCKMQTATPE